MKYAVYADGLPNPIKVWDEVNETYVPAIYDTLGEALDTRKNLEHSERYSIHPYQEEFDITLLREEMNILIGLCTLAIEYFGDDDKEKAEQLQTLQDKLRRQLKCSRN